MKSYIKIYGPPLKEALKSLRKVAVDFPEVCVMDQTISATLGLEDIRATGSGAVVGQGQFDSPVSIMNYFDSNELSEERCDTIISKSGESIGEYDFYYEWFTKPTISQIEDLIVKIDEALTPTGVRYTITTK